MNRRILVVDDEKDIREIFSAFLSNAGYGVATAHDFDSAIKTLGSRVFDLVYADILMPEKSGVDLLKQIKGQRPGTPVIMITGQPSLETASDAVRLGAFDYVVKPIRKETLLRITRGALGHKDLVDEKTRLEQELAKREKNLRALFNATTESAILMDTKGNILAINEVGAMRLKTTPEKIVGKNIGDCLSPEAAARRSIWRGKAISEKKPVRFEDERDGMILDINIYPVPDDKNQVTQLAVFARDITDQRKTQEALRQREQLYQAIVQQQTEIICRCKPDGTITFMNDAAEKIFDIPKAKLLGMNNFDLIFEDDLESCRKTFLGLTSENPAAEHEVRIKAGNRDVRWMNCNTLAVFDADDNLVEFQSVGRDITEKKKAEEDLRRAVQEKEKYRLNLEATFRSIPDAIITVDKDMKIITTNQAATKLCGGSHDLAPGAVFLRSQDHQSCPCKEALEQTLKTGKEIQSYQVECQAGGNNNLVVELNTSPLLGSNNQHRGAVLVIKDISRLADLEKQLDEKHSFRNIIGKSKKMREIYALLDNLAFVDATVLVQGESGTGKELIVDALHYGGMRAAGPLVKVNCSALSENLLESELFGHVRGAFTGAMKDKTGRIQAAEKGTLFLDEIGDLSPRIQLKLLRFLEQKEFERVGDSKTCKADVRVVAATNVDLTTKVRKGAFREDLYYRLKVMVINLPPLRQRTEDIPLLVEHFLQLNQKSLSKNFSRTSNEVMNLFMNHVWPGNVRELRHAIEHACILSPGGIIGIKDLPKDLVQQAERESEPSAEPEEKLDAPDDIMQALRLTGGNKAKAARMLGIDRSTLYRKLKRMGVDI